jgi:hypothetical protein
MRATEALVTVFEASELIRRLEPATEREARCLCHAGAIGEVRSVHVAVGGAVTLRTGDVDRDQCNIQ